MLVLEVVKMSPPVPPVPTVVVELPPSPVVP